MSSKIFSVIIPVFNCENYLKICLNNLINQTYSNIEIICIDDGSTDNSLSILREYADKDERVKIIQQTHKGAAAARNTGLAAAKGEYISFIDADDIVSTNLYLKVHRILSKNNFEIVMFNAGFYNQKTKCISKDNFFKISGIKNHKDEYSIHTYKDLTYMFYGNESVVNKIYKKEFLDKFSFKFNEKSNFEDRYFNFATLLNAKEISVLNERLYLYRRNRKGSMNSRIFNRNSKIVLEVFQDIEDIEKLVLINFVDLKEELYDFIYMILIYYFMNAPFKIKSEFYNKMKQKFIIMKYWNINRDKLITKKQILNPEFVIKHDYIVFYISQLLYNLQTKSTAMFKRLKSII